MKIENERIKKMNIEINIGSSSHLKDRKQMVQLRNIGVVFK